MSIPPIPHAVTVFFAITTVLVFLYPVSKLLPFWRQRWRGDAVAVAPPEAEREEDVPPAGRAGGPAPGC